MTYITFCAVRRLTGSYRSYRYRAFLALLIISVLLFYIFIAAKVWALELSLDFFDFPKETASLFKAKFPVISKEIENIEEGPVQLFVYYDEEKGIYKATIVLGLDLAVFGVDKRRVISDKLDLSPFTAYFLALDDYLEAIRDASDDASERKLISKMVMSIMLINERGDMFEIYGDTDFFLGVREAIISPNFIFERKSKEVIAVYMEPTEIVSQVFILPPARDEKGGLTPISLIYDFFFFEY